MNGICTLAIPAFDLSLTLSYGHLQPLRVPYDGDGDAPDTGCMSQNTSFNADIWRNASMINDMAIVSDRTWGQKYIQGKK